MSGLLQFGHPPTGVTTFTQGFIGGGGYQVQIDIAHDDNMVLHTDVPGVYRSIAGAKWYPIVTSPGFDATGMRWGTSTAGAHCVCQAPSNSNRIYLCIGPPTPTFDTTGRPFGWYSVYRSDDAATFTEVLTKVQGNDPNAGNERVSGPKMAVDPNNPDVCYIAISAGIFLVTYDAGVTWAVVNSLLANMPTAQVTANQATFDTSLTIGTGVPASLTSLFAAASSFGLDVYGYNFTAPLSVGSNGFGFDTVGAISSTVLSVGKCMPRTGTTTSTSVNNGDVFYFGVGGTVAIDGSSGTVANTGGTGVRSKNVYFGWFCDVTGQGVWRTTDGDPEHATSMGSGPVYVNHWEFSNDSALVGPAGANILYAVGDDGGISQPGWRYVSAVPNGSSGLSANQWIRSPINTGAGLDKLAPDPSTAGKVTGVSSGFLSGRTNTSLDFGNTGAGEALGVITTPAGQPGWIDASCEGFGANNSQYDHSGNLWIATGISLYKTTPVHNTSNLPWNVAVAGIESLVVQQIVKTPSPNGRVLVACQDRPAYSMANASTYADSYNPSSTNIQQAGDITYADNDPTVVFASNNAQVWRSQNKGIKGSWVLIGQAGVNGYVAPPGGSSTGGAPKLAAPNTLRVVHMDESSYSNLQVGIPTGDPNVGSNWNWTDCLDQFSATISSEAYNGTYVNSNKYIDTDGAQNVYYFDRGIPAIFKSTDGGSNFTKTVSTPNSFGFYGFSGIGGNLVCIRGKPNQLLQTAGTQFGILPFGPLNYSSDGGATWANTPHAAHIWQACVGKAKPGGSGFPAVFASGIFDFSTEPGVFRCDDYDGAQTWIRLDNIRKITLQSSGAMSGDPDVYGSVYVACGAAGYVAGTIS